ncbi:MAG TPA: hypothetical protein VFS52_23205 [Steroidobacteraceae bacterium]|nr:hypothetical protein [Steroidobacteraceae bacterium]
MKTLDAVTAGVLEGKRKERVQETGEAGADHANRKPAGLTEVLQVGLANRGRMFSEETPYSHAVSLGNRACDSVSLCPAGQRGV